MDSYKKQIIEQAERELEKIRLQNEKNKEKAKQEVYKKVPRIKEIDILIKNHGLETASKVIKGNSPKFAISNFKKELLALVKEKRELLKENGFPPRYMELKYHCNKCQDTGVEDNHYCKCRDEIIRKLSFQFSGLQDRKLPDFNEFNLNCYDKDHMQKGASAQQNAANILEFCMNYEKGNLLFYGKPGLGKTFVSGCIAKKMMRQGKIVCYMSAPSMFSLLDEIKFGRDTSSRSKQQAEFLYDADILIIDDLGTEFRTALNDSTLFHILNTRLSGDKSTIINTNLGLDVLMETYSERISSRLVGEYKAFKFFGEDIRRKKGKRK